MLQGKYVQIHGIHIGTKHMDDLLFPPICKCASDAHLTVPLGHGRGVERNKSQDNDNMAGDVRPAIHT